MLLLNLLSGKKFIVPFKGEPLRFLASNLLE